MNSVPKQRDSNLDPISGAPGAHPAATGVGAAAGGGAGAAVGAVAGPVGMAIGAAVGAVAGGLAGKAARWLAQVNETRSVQIYRIGTPFYWRRALGDLRRRWVGSWRRATNAESAEHNPAPREIGVDTAAPPDAAQVRQVASAERQRSGELIAQAQRGRIEILTAAQFAAAMPFPTALAPAGNAVLDDERMVAARGPYSQ